LAKLQANHLIEKAINVGKNKSQRKPANKFHMMMMMAFLIAVKVAKWVNGLGL